MTASERHPDLPAFVAGILPAGEASEARRHLEECGVCREEERALRSLRRSLLTPPQPHPSVEELVALDERGGTGAPAGPKATHAAECVECRADLEALARARRHRHPLEPADAEGIAPGRAADSNAPGRAAALRPMRLGFGVAAVVAIAVAGGGLFLIGRRASTAPPPWGFTTLAPPTRGDGAPPVLRAGATVTLRVILPFGSPGGAYDSRLEDAHGRIAQAGETSVAKDGEILEVRLRAPAEPGEYRLAVLPADPGASPIVYPVHVASGLPEDSSAR